MTATPKNALRRPVLTDTANVPRDIQNLADDVDGRLITPCTEATPSDTRPTGTARYDGAMIYCTDTDSFQIWDNGATQWRRWDTGAWRAYTPVWSTTGAAGAMNAGNRIGWYRETGQVVEVEINCGWSALGGGEGLGTGFYLFSTPSTINSFYPVDFNLGVASVLDAGVTTFIGTANVWDNTRVYMNLNGGKVSESFPVTPTNSDRYFLKFSYRKNV